MAQHVIAKPSVAERAQETNDGGLGILRKLIFADSTTCCYSFGLC